MSIAEWQGGKGSVPWNKIAKDGSHSYIDSKRLPRGILSLRDPHQWNRAEIETWYKHLIAGQNRDIPDDVIFQFSLVEQGTGTTPQTYRELCSARLAACTLAWGPDEKLYALKLSNQSDSVVNRSGWNGLPLARTTCIYEPLDTALKAILSDMSTSNVQLGTLVSLLDEMEELGPVHVGDASHRDPPLY